MLSVVFKPIAFKAAKLHLAAAGQPETEEQQLCRQLTLSTYTHATEGMKRSAADTIGNVISQAM